MASTKSARILERRSKRAFEELQIQIAVETCRRKVDPPGFVERHVSEYIGDGMFTTTPFKNGEFLLEYSGDLICYKETERREKEYAADEIGCFMMKFKFRESLMCVDATNDIFSKGRLINDAERGSKEENCHMKMIVVDKRPHLCMFANRDIDEGDELRYDYGVSKLPWRKACLL